MREHDEQVLEFGNEKFLLDSPAVKWVLQHFSAIEHHMTVQWADLDFVGALKADRDLVQTEGPAYFKLRQEEQDALAEEENSLHEEEEALIDPQFGIFHTQIAVVLDGARKSLEMEHRMRAREAAARLAKEEAVTLDLTAQGRWTGNNQARNRAATTQ